MGWIRKFIINLIVREIETNGIIIGGYQIYDEGGTLTIKRAQ
jgi:hypothetical protein